MSRLNPPIGASVKLKGDNRWWRCIKEAEDWFIIKSGGTIKKETKENVEEWIYGIRNAQRR